MISAWTAHTLQVLHDDDAGQTCRRTAATIDDLPQVLLLQILSHLPRLVDRVRCCIVAKRWATLLREPPFWAHLSFQGVKKARKGLVLELGRRAAGELRSLDLANSDDDKGMRRVIDALAAEGLLVRLESLAASTLDSFACINAESALALRASLPAAASVVVANAQPRWWGEGLEMDTQPRWRGEGLAVVRALRLSGRSSIFLLVGTIGRKYTEEVYHIAFAEAVAGMLSTCTLESLEFVLESAVDNSDMSDAFVYHDPNETGIFEGFCRSGTGAESMRRAVEQLATAIASADHGPRSFKVKAVSFHARAGLHDLYRHTFWRLTSQSRLRRLDISRVTNLIVLAGALASGESKLESLTIRNSDLIFPINER